MDFRWDSPFRSDIAFGYIGKNAAAPQRHNPRMVLNHEGNTVLHTLLEELKGCETFTFSVAFVTPGAVALMIKELVEFDGVGRVITSDYLGFNSPDAFAELHKLRGFGIDVRLHNDTAFHPKGYIFEHRDIVTAVVGSSNLTKTALATNHEWNLKVSAATSSDLFSQISELVDREVLNSRPLTEEWIEEYRKTWIAPPSRTATLLPDRVVEPPHFEVIPELQTEIIPNLMQIDALEALAQVRAEGETKAIIISATGTGKTILSALDVRAVAPARLLFVVHREQILDRTIEAFHQVLGGPLSDYGKLAGSSKQSDRRYVFATVQTLSQAHVLQAFSAGTFDYIIIDEAHRSGANSYARILSHFRPKFLLGMTATPERGDGINIFELYGFNVPYEIRLNHALEANMLSPFHYYGVADVTYESQDSPSEDFSVLISPERVDHVIRAIETYGQAGVAPRGLIFCSRKTEARALSTALNSRSLRGKPLRTIALTGDDNVEFREQAVERFEAGELDYILTVDVFNEGVDIPTINQVIMLRQTKSAIVFVQQLGRGLRKASGKDYLVVIDFIGNYANNYLIPIALFGDESLNKESLRKNLISAEESGVLPGLSSVRFDRIAQERVLRSITTAKLDSMVMLKAAVTSIYERVGGIPSLWDFLRFESVDPVVLATKLENYPTLAAKILGTPSGLTADENRMLGLLSHEVLTSKRPHEFRLLRLLLDQGSQSTQQIAAEFGASGISSAPAEIESAIDTLTIENHSEVDHTRYRSGIAERKTREVALTANFREAYEQSRSFRTAVDDLLKTGAHIVIDRYAGGDPFVQGAQYSRKEVTRLLNFPRKWTSTLYGYKADKKSRTCPIFVTLHKSEEVSASTAYGDALLDRSTLLWYTKSNRTLRSPLERAIAAAEYRLPIFVKKDDAEGSEFYYLGDATPTDAEETTMPGNAGTPVNVARMHLGFDSPIDTSLFDYFHPSLTQY
jgi:superfamily II DNA or RNA helicase/HKD family nuclease